MDDSPRLLLRKGNIAYVANSSHVWIPSIQRQKEGERPEYSDSIVNVDRALETFIRFRARRDEVQAVRSWLVAIAFALVEEENHWRSGEILASVRMSIVFYTGHDIRGASHNLLKQIKDLEETYEP